MKSQDHGRISFLESKINEKTASLFDVLGWLRETNYGGSTGEIALLLLKVFIADFISEAQTDRAIQKAAGQLPKGWTMTVEIVNGLSSVGLYRGDEGDTIAEKSDVTFPSDYPESLTEVLNAALEYAIKTAQEGS
jgi:hypothetical protein